MTLDNLEAALLNGRYTPELPRLYYDRVRSMALVDRGRLFLQDLLHRKPSHRQLLSLYIALCLDQKDYQAAMPAVEKLLSLSTPDDQLIDIALSIRQKVGFPDLAATSGKHPTISLCIIVKNERAGLAACLNAAKAIADEIIVIDTGSKDRSSDIAEIYGARTFDYPWQDDFADARNFAIEQARGDWIFILDADEIMAPEDQKEIRRLIASPQRNVGYSIETRNYTNMTNCLNWQANTGDYAEYEAGLGWFPSRKIRLFPRRPDIRFCYPVHELVDPAIKAAGFSVIHPKGCIHHYGHLNELKNRGKAETYFRIGYAKLQSLGDDFAAVRELAVQAGQLEYWPEAIMLWEKVLGLCPGYAEAYVNMSGACWQMGRYRDAIHYGRQALALIPDLKEAHYNVAVSKMLEGQADQSAAILKKLTADYPDYLAARFMMGAALSFVGNIQESLTIFKALQNTAAGPALCLAIKDLIQRLQRNNQEKYAALLLQATDFILCPSRP